MRRELVTLLPHTWKVVYNIVDHDYKEKEEKYKKSIEEYKAENEQLKKEL